MKPIETITMTENITLISLEALNEHPNGLVLLFELIEDTQLNVDMISQTLGSSFSFTVADEDLTKVLEVTSKLREEHPKLKLSVRSGNSKLVAYSKDMPLMSGVATKLFRAVSDAHADLLMVTTSDEEISFLIPGADSQNALRQLMQIFDITERK